MRKTYIIAETIAVSMVVSITAVAVPPVNDDCDTGAIVIDQATCTLSTEIGNCAKNKSSWCSPLFSQCANGDGTCIPILDNNAVELVDHLDCDIIATDNQDATSGYPISTNAPNCSDSFFGSDIWWTIVAPCSGMMNITMCGGSEYDAMLATYDFCPDPIATVIVVPLSCNDDGCGTPNGLSGPASFAVNSGQEVFIRVGGWAGDTSGSIMPAAEGQSEIDVRFACFHFCPLSIFPVGVSGEAGFTKDRYVTIDASQWGQNGEAIRVTREGGADKFLDCTSIQDKGAEGYFGTLIDGPLPLPGDPTYYCDLSSVSVLHMTGCSVMPGNTYNIGVTADGVNYLDSSDYCGGLYFPVETTSPQAVLGRSFGDLVGGFVGGVWTAPDTLVTANDIVAVVQKFSLVPNAPIIARVDTDGAVPNGIVAGNDILRVVIGFAGSEFGYGVTDCLTGTCVPPVGSCE